MRSVDKNASKACGRRQDKKAYVKPRLLCHGDIRKVTRGGIGNPIDGQATGQLGGFGDS